MAFLGYVVGAAALLVAIAAVASGANAVRAHVVPHWDGALGYLVVVVFSLSAVTLASEILGSVGLFRVVPVTVALVGVGAAARFLLPRRPLAASDSTPTRPVAPSPLSPRAEAWARRTAFAAVLLVSSEWLTATVRSFQVGMSAVDATWYHMPTAARFAQSGSTWNLHVMDTSSLTLFYPAGSELFHAVGMIFLHTDSLSHVLNLGWLALALLAAWCIGARYGVAPLSLLGGSLLLATPQLVGLEAGQALNDVAVTALLLAAAAAIVNGFSAESGRSPAGAIVVAATAAGMAAGTKWTAIISVVALTVSIPFLSKARDRVRNTIVWIGVVAMSGGYWYFRNLVAAGSPVPPQRIGVGPIQLPYSPPGIPVFSLTHYLTDSNAWHHVILPGLRASFGPLWWLVLLLAAGALAAGVVHAPDGRIRVASVVGIACVGSYLLTKQGFTLRFWPGTPRYAAPGLALGLALLPTTLLRARRVALHLVLALYTGTIIITQFDSRLWRAWWTADYRAVVIVVAIAAAAVAAMSTPVRTLRPTRLRPRITAPVVAGVLLLTCLGSGIALRSYEPEFVNYGISESTAARLLRDRGVRHARIALSGNLILSGVQYDFYDKGLTNYVQYVGDDGPDHSVVAFSRCGAFFRAIDKGRFRYVVATSPGPGSVNAAVWLRSNPRVRSIGPTARSSASVFEIVGRLDPTSCQP